MSNLFSRVLAIVTVLSIAGTALADAPKLDGQKIMVKSEEATRLPQFMAKAILKSLKKNGESKEKSFLFWRKLKGDGVHYRSLTRFTAPSEVKGEAILFLENDQGVNDILLYLPTYQKTRRIERTQQSSSFMGSDFSYSDLTIPHSSDYKYTLSKEESCPSESAYRCYRIEGEPITESIRTQTGYSKMIVWVRTDNFLMAQIDDFDLTGVFTKSVMLSDPVKQPSGKWFQKKIVVMNQKEGGQTSLLFSDLKTEEKIEDSIFTQQALGKGSK